MILLGNVVSMECPVGQSAVDLSKPSHNAVGLSLLSSLAATNRSK